MCVWGGGGGVGILQVSLFVNVVSLRKYGIPILYIILHHRCQCSLCQRLSLTQSMRNRPQAQSTKRESPLEAKDEQSDSFTGGARGFAQQIRAVTSSSGGC